MVSPMDVHARLDTIPTLGSPYVNRVDPWHGATNDDRCHSSATMSEHGARHPPE